MDQLFNVVFLEEAFRFLQSLDKKHAEKILYNIRKSQTSKDPELFKKLNEDIWEFQTLYHGHQYRLLAFWDKMAASDTIVVSWNGFVKKRSRVPENEIERAKQLRARYFAEKQKDR
ncbi:MAG TPA: type II toxin-antitoxin system RelE/ParE family toxin [Dyadobacter sp.]|nr:type II toxin-antitoxin system RelE/ParE family toxin [Dyadobacter sp.]